MINGANFSNQSVSEQMSQERVGAAIVTGASSGIGRAAAIRLAAAGYDVAITFHRNRGGADDVSDEIQRLGRTSACAQLDLANPAAAHKVITALIEELDGVDVLVNNAGVNRRAAALEETHDGFEHTLAVDLIAPWACARTAAEHMIGVGRGGRIVNVTSVLAFAPIEGGAAYCAAKAGLEALTKVMALELAPHQITVNSVAPGHTATPMNYSAAEASAAVVHRPVIPARRAASPEEIASGIAYIASPDASYASGTSLLIDGGLLLRSGPESLQQAIRLPTEGTASRL